MTPEERWEEFLAEHRRWLRRIAWAWTISVVLFAAVVIWRFGP